MNEKEKIFTKNLYRETKVSLEKDYFKSLLNLSAGALALSITISQIAFNTELNFPWLLLSSWILLGLTVVLVLSYFVLAQYEFKKRIEDINLQNDPLARNDKELEKLAKATDAQLKGKKIAASWILNEEGSKRKLYESLGLISSFALTLGIAALGAFTYLNLFPS